MFAQWEGSFERWTTDGHEHVEVVSFDYSRVLDFLSLVDLSNISSQLRLRLVSNLAKPRLTLTLSILMWTSINPRPYMKTEEHGYSKRRIRRDLYI